MSGRPLDDRQVPAPAVPVYPARTQVPRDLRTADELRGRGYPVPPRAAAWLDLSDGLSPLYSTTEARRLRGDMWLRPRGAHTPLGAGSRAGRLATAAGLAKVRSHTPVPPGRYHRPALSREPRRWLHELFREGFAVVDLETTGLGRSDEVVEVAAVAADGTVLFESLVRPKRGYVPAAATRVHGLTMAHLVEAPPWPEVVDALADALSGYRVLAWNASFDERLAAQSSRVWSVEHPLPGFECAMRAYAVCRGLSSGGVRLSRAAVIEGVLVGEQSHRSAGDAALTVAVLRALHARQAQAA
ncbi:MAG TPA: 3'-5' exonuclease [Trueperaceae bacterium]|nr:3'-5' exonuclease [Trueperaceae bacterium]